MNFRRQPFQFTSIDPVKRHAELQKRFGLPSDEMFLDNTNPGVMGAGEESVINGSPRLQHRVPIFSQGVHSTKSTGIHNNVDNGHQPCVRVIPIQVEGVNDAPRKQQTFSCPAIKRSDVRKRSADQRFDPQPKFVNAATKNVDPPRVCNIPIKVELNNKEQETKCKETVTSTVCEQKMQPPEVACNGCTVSELQEPLVCKSLKQIEEVLKKLKGYQVQVENFTGTNKDKLYRYLDEMLTRCMLDLDNVDTLGIDSVRQSRKNAVKQVQACIDLLEVKVTSQSTVAEITESIPPVGSANTDASGAQLVVQKDVMVADTEMKDCVTDLENENTKENSAASSQLTQTCDIEMEDKSLVDQSSKIVVEKLEEPGENLTDTHLENQGVGVIEKSTKEVEGSLSSERVESNLEGITPELVIEEMCSNIEKSLDQEKNVYFDINVEPVITEPDSTELSELSDINASNEQISTFSSNKFDRDSSSNAFQDNEKISITEIPNNMDIIVEES